MALAGTISQRVRTDTQSAGRAGEQSPWGSANPQATWVLKSLDLKEEHFCHLAGKEADRMGSSFKKQTHSTRIIDTVCSHHSPRVENLNVNMSDVSLCTDELCWLKHLEIISHIFIFQILVSVYPHLLTVGWYLVFSIGCCTASVSLGNSG